MALPENNPFNEYKKTQIATANQGKLIVMLYDGAIKFLNIAIDNMSPQTYDIVNTNILKAQELVALSTESVDRTRRHLEMTERRAAMGMRTFCVNFSCNAAFR